MALTTKEVITSASLGAGVHVFPTRRISVPAGTRGLTMVVLRNTDVSPTWFRPGYVLFQVIMPNLEVVGFEAIDLYFDTGIVWIPPQSVWGNDFRATLNLRNFLPPVPVQYGRVLDN